MSNYRERFVIPGLPDLGIEDCTSPGDHLMPNRIGPQFQLWSGGCGIGSRDTIAEARAHIHLFACYRLNRRILEAKQQLATLEESRDALGNDAFSLGQFLKKE